MNAEELFDMLIAWHVSGVKLKDYEVWFHTVRGKEELHYVCSGVMFMNNRLQFVSGQPLPPRK